MHLNILLCSNDEKKRKQNYNWIQKENKKLNSKCGIPHHHHFTAHKQRPFYVIFTLIFYSKVLWFLVEFFFASWALRSKMRENGMQHKSKWVNERSCACAKKIKMKWKTNHRNAFLPTNIANAIILWFHVFKYGYLCRR